MTEAEVAQTNAGMNWLGLAYALSIADRFEQYDQIPDLGMSIWRHSARFEERTDCSLSGTWGNFEFRDENNIGAPSPRASLVKHTWFPTAGDTVKSDVFLESRKRDIIMFEVLAGEGHV